MAKYLNQADIKINHWYVDNKGEKLLYLGEASQDNGCWSYPKAYIYIKESVLSRHFKGDLNNYSVETMLNKMEELGVRHYCFSQTPRKFCFEAGNHPDAPLHGNVGIFMFL